MLLGGLLEVITLRLCKALPQMLTQDLVMVDSGFGWTLGSDGEI